MKRGLVKILKIHHKLKIMKKLQAILMLFFIAAILVSCKPSSDRHQIQFDQFSKEKNLNGKTVSIKDSIPLKLVQIEKIDSLLIALDNSRKDKRLYIFNINNFSLIGSAGIVGKGPKELTVPISFTVDQGKQIIWVTDRGKSKIFGYSIDSILNKEKKIPTYEVNPKQENLHFTCIRHYKDSLFALAEETPELIKIMNYKGKIVDSLGYIPEERKEKEPKLGFYMIWRRNIRLMKNNDILISFMNFDKIMKIDSDGNTKFLTKGPDQITQHRTFKDGYWKHSMNDKRGYGALHKYQDRIYGLYSGDQYFKKEKHNIRQQYFKHIHIFNETGEPLIKYNLGNEIRDFVIDKNKKRIIGVTINKDKPFIAFPL